MRFKNLDNYIKLLIVGLILILFYKSFTIAPFIKKGFLALAEIMRPFIYGFILAFLMWPFEQKIETIIEKYKPDLDHSKKRLISSLIVFFIVTIILVIFIWILVPIIIENGIEFIYALIDSIPSLIDSIQQYIHNVSIRDTIIQIINSYDYNDLVNSALSIDAAGIVTDYIGQFSKILIGYVLFPYFLYEKESLNTILYNLTNLVLPNKHVNKIDKYLEQSSVIFYSFIYGKIIDSAIIGLIVLVAFLIFGFHFSIIYALIVGLTNIIPYFGPFIGGIPVTIMVFLTDGFIPAVICGLFIIALQWFDGLVLGPYILGEQVGIRPFWIVFAITLFQGLFGFVGMVIGVPVVAIVGMLLNDLVAKNKRKRKIQEILTDTNEE